MDPLGTRVAGRLRKDNVDFGGHVAPDALDVALASHERLTADIEGRPAGKERMGADGGAGDGRR